MARVCFAAVLVQIVFFVFGLCYGASTFLTAASVYVSAYKEVPEGECKLLVKLCAWVRTTVVKEILDILGSGLRQLH